MANLVSDYQSRMLVAILRACPGFFIDMHHDPRLKCNIRRFVVFVRALEQGHSRPVSPYPLAVFDRTSFYKFDDVEIAAMRASTGREASRGRVSDGFLPSIVDLVVAEHAGRPLMSN